MVMLTTSLFPEDKFKAREIPEISGFENKPLTPRKIRKNIKRTFSRSPLMSSAGFTNQ